MTDKKYRVGLVGLGEISSYFINGVQQNPLSEMVAVCRRSSQPDDAEKYKGLSFYNDWKLLVDDPKVNVVIIATPPSSHHAITEYALTRHKKVVVEKPYSLKVEEAKVAVKLAQDNKTHLNFAYHAAMNPLSLQAKDKIQEALKTGDAPVKFHILSKEDVRNYHGTNSWIFNPAISGGGCLIDSGVNYISIIENIGVGHVVPTKVSVGHKTDSGIDVEISADVDFKSEKNPELTGHFDQEWLHVGPENREVIVTFKSGKSIGFDYAKGTVFTKHKDGNVEVHAAPQRDQADHHLTPMAHEYINVVNAAIKQFETDNYVDDIGYGPFDTIMQCYELVAKSK